MANGKYIEVDPGVELYVEDTGSGEPIVFIPGITFTTEVFSEQVAYFSKTRRVITIDPRSHGRSTVTLHGNDYVTHGTDLAKVIEALQLENVTLAGWSFGCLTIWEYIRQYGVQGIRSLVLVDLSSKPLSVNPETDWVEGPLDEIAAAYTFFRNPQGQRAFMKDYAEQVMVQRDLTEEELDWIVGQSLRTPYYIAANLFASGMFSDYREEAALAAEAVPTLNVIAEHWAEQAEAFVKKTSPQSKIEVLGGHLMFWEHSDAFNERLEKFLSES